MLHPPLATCSGSNRAPSDTVSNAIMPLRDYKRKQLKTLWHFGVSRQTVSALWERYNTTQSVRVCVCVHLCACVCVCVRMCVSLCVCPWITDAPCVYACVFVHVNMCARACEYV